MRIYFVMTESIYDCKIQITDTQGSRCYTVDAAGGGETQALSVTAEVFDSDFDVTLTPLMPDASSILNEWEPNRLKDKLAKKAVRFLFSSLDKAVLRVGCVYHVSDVQEGDRLDINLQSYVFGAFDRFDLLELAPAIYAFFDVASFNERCKLTNAFGTNRKEVLKTAKSLAIAECFAEGLFSWLLVYPFQMGRIKFLTKDKKIRKTLTAFNNFSPEERKSFLEKQEKYFER